MHEDVIIAAGEPDAEQGGEQSHRNNEDHRQRQRPAFIQRRQHQERQKYRHREDNQRRVALGGLLEAQIRPFDVHTIRQQLAGHRGQFGHRLSGREYPRIGVADQIRRRIAVVADHRIRPVGRADIDHTADRHHFTLVIPGAQIGNILHAVAERPVGLRHDAPGSAELVKVVHIR